MSRKKTTTTKPGLAVFGKVMALTLLGTPRKAESDSDCNMSNGQDNPGPTPQFQTAEETRVELKAICAVFFFYSAPATSRLRMPAPFLLAHSGSVVCTILAALESLLHDVCHLQLLGMGKVTNGSALCTLQTVWPYSFGFWSRRGKYDKVLAPLLKMRDAIFGS